MKHKLLATTLLTMICLSFGKPSQSAPHLKFAKCTFQVKMSGNGIGAHRVPVRITAWARLPIRQTRANSRATRTAHVCVKTTLLQNLSVVPRVCRNHRTIHDGSKIGRGVAGYTITNGFNLLKKTLCSKLKPKPHTTGKVKTIADFKRQNTHRIEGFKIWLRKVRGKNHCPSSTFFGPRAITVHCKQRGVSSLAIWYHK